MSHLLGGHLDSGVLTDILAFLFTLETSSNCLWSVHRYSTTLIFGSS